VLVTLLFLLLIVGGTVAAGGLWVASKRRTLPAGSGSAPKQLPASTVERTIRDLKVADVLTIDSRDFLVEGVIAYDEDGHRWSGARIVDGKDTQWVVVGIERIGLTPVRLLVQDAEHDVSGYPPEVMVIGETRYALEKRGTATCKLTGDLGSLTKKDLLPDSVERCRWWLYDGAGDDTLVLEQWGGEYRVLRGKKVGTDTIDLIPGS
jgi:hypothetical protein